MWPHNVACQGLPARSSRSYREDPCPGAVYCHHILHGLDVGRVFFSAWYVCSIASQVSSTADTLHVRTWSRAAFANNLSSLTDLEAAAVNSIVRFVCTDTDSNMTPTELLVCSHPRMPCVVGVCICGVDSRRLPCVWR